MEDCPLSDLMDQSNEHLIEDYHLPKMRLRRHFDIFAFVDLLIILLYFVNRHFDVFAFFGNLVKN